MSLRIFLLGRFEVWRDGVLINSWPRPAAKRLLKMLAVEPSRSLKTERIAAALWPDDDGSRNAKRLHHLMYLLRSALSVNTAAIGQRQPGYLQVQQQVIQLSNDHRVWVDVDAFETGLDIASAGDSSIEDLQRSLSLYQGPLLPDDLTESWLNSHRNHLEQRYINGMHLLADRLCSDGQIEQAVEVFHRLLKTAPADERAHQALMTLYGKLSRRSEVERQYAECRSALNKELGVTANPATRAIYEAALLSCDEVKSLSSVVATATNLAISRNRSNKQVTTEAAPKRFNAPALLVPLIGRDELLQRTINSIVNGCRLLSLTGTGGVGKTQLALHVAHQLDAAFTDGVCVVQLSDAKSDQVAHCLRQVLGLSDNGVLEQSIDDITAFLRDKHLLLILDNFEHVLEAAALLPKLLQASARLHVLVTSRRRLNLACETTIAVPGLATQPSSDDLSVDGHALPDACQLFMERARAASAHFQLSKADYPHLLAITRCLNGLPLAIELAAARVCLLDMTSLRQTIEKNPSALSGGGVDRPLRHRSLSESLRWTLSLHSALEQDVLLRLSLFALSFDLTAATSVCTDLCTDPSYVLQDLVETGLVGKREYGSSATQAVCYYVPEATKQFVKQIYANPLTQQIAKQAFVNCFVRLLHITQQPSKSVGFYQVLSCIDLAHDNFIAALEYAWQIQDLTNGQVLYATLHRYWRRYGLRLQAQRWFERLAEKLSADLSANSPALLCSFAYQCADTGKYAAAHRYASAALYAANAANRVEQIADSLLALAEATLGLSDPQTALDLYQHAYQAALKTDLVHQQWAALDGVCQTYLYLNELHAACDTVYLSAALLDEMSSSKLCIASERAQTAQRLAVSLMSLGQVDQATQLLEQAVQLEQDALPATKQRLIQTLLVQTRLLCLANQAEVARQRLQQAMALSTDQAQPFQREMVLLDAIILSLCDQWPRARQNLLRLYQDTGARLAPEAEFELALCLSRALSRTAQPQALHSSAKVLLQLAQQRLHFQQGLERMLELAAQLFIQQEKFQTAAQAWFHAKALRFISGSVRFAAEQPQANDVLGVLSDKLGRDFVNDQDKSLVPDRVAATYDSARSWLINEIEQLLVTSAHQLSAVKIIR